MAILFLFIISSLHSSIGHISDSDSSLNLISYCGCPGYTLIYECTVMGSHFGTTVWRGSAFDCASSEISLLHNNYNSTMRAYGECNNGSIVAQGLRTENGVTYISQLNISVSTNIIGRTIECLYDLTTFLLVGSAIISDLSEYFPPPNISEVVDEISRKITFNWTQVSPECSTIHYNILASNCGSCPTTTNYTTVTCTDTPTNGVCTFTVQTVVCGYNTGEESKISVTLGYNTTYTVLYVITGILLVIMFIVFSVILGIFVIRLIARARVRKKLIPCCPNQQTITSHQQVDGIYACVSKTTKQDDYATIKVFDNENKGVYGVEDTHTLNEKHRVQFAVHERPPNLTSLLCQFQGQASLQWYQIGLAFGVPKDYLKQLKEYPENDCIIEVLKFWLRNHQGQPTWQEVADVQNEVKIHWENNTKQEPNYSIPFDKRLDGKLNIYN